MSIQVVLHHATRYRYERLIQLGPQIARLGPAPHYFRKVPAARCFEAYPAAIPRLEKPTTGFLFDLNAQLHRDIEYLVREEPGIQTPEETLEKMSGSCRDSTWLLVQLLRHLSGRSVSGYLLTEAPSGQPRLLDSDATHAWFAVWAPPFGWVDLDLTNDMRAGEGHVTIARGP